MKTQILILIASVAITFASCKNDERTYTFGETKVTFDPDDSGFDFSNWNLKEMNSSGRMIYYYFESSRFPGEFWKYYILPEIKNDFNEYGYPDSLEFEIMKKRAEMWIRKIDSVNKSEINAVLNELSNY